MMDTRKLDMIFFMTFENGKDLTYEEMSDYLFDYLTIFDLKQKIPERLILPCFRDFLRAGDERIELPPKVLETPIIPFDQSPVYKYNEGFSALIYYIHLSFVFQYFFFCTFKISHRSFTSTFLVKPSTD